MAELPKATFDGTTLTIGAAQTVPQLTYKTRVSSGIKYAFVYVNMHAINEFIGVVPGQYWFNLPPSINKRNTTQINTYVRSVLNAPTPVQEVANVDDSYSLRDIVDFRTNVANVSIAGNHDWEDENTVKLSTNTIFQFNPKTGWAAKLDDDGNSMTVTPGQNYTVMGPGVVTLISLQFVAQDGSIDIYEGDMKTTTLNGKPLAYYGGYAIGDWTSVELWEQPAYGKNSHGYIIEIRRSPDNAVTGVEGSYYVRRILPWNDTGEWSSVGPVADGSRVGMTLEKAQGIFNKEKAAAEADAEQTRLAQIAADDEAREGTVIHTEVRGSIEYNVRYIGDGRYSITGPNDLLIAIYDATDDPNAVVMAQAKIDAYHKAQYQSGGGSWGILFASVLGVAAILGLIVWLRSRKEA